MQTSANELLVMDISRLELRLALDGQWSLGRKFQEFGIVVGDYRRLGFPLFMVDLVRLLFEFLFLHVFVARAVVHRTRPVACLLAGNAPRDFPHEMRRNGELLH